MIRLPVRASTRCGSSLTPANNKRVKTTYIRYFSTAKGVIHLTDENWKQVVEEGSKKGPVVVDFKAEWCGPCKMLAPSLEKASAELGITLAKYDIDESSSMADAFSISSIPAVIAFSQGQPIAKFQGAIPHPKVVEFLNDVKAKHLQHSQPL